MGRVGKRVSTVSANSKELTGTTSVLDRVKKNNARNSNPSPKKTSARKGTPKGKETGMKELTESESDQESGPPILTRSRSNTSVVVVDEMGAVKSVETLQEDIICEIQENSASPLTIDLVSSNDSADESLNAVSTADEMSVDDEVGSLDQVDRGVHLDEELDLELLQKAVREDLAEESETTENKADDPGAAVTEVKVQQVKSKTEVVPMEVHESPDLEDLLAANKPTMRKLPTSRAVDSKKVNSSPVATPTKKSGVSLESPKSATPDIMLVAGNERKPTCISLLIEHSGYFRNILSDTPKKSTGMLKYEVDLQDPSVLGLLVRKIKQSRITVTYDEAFQLLRPAIKLEMDVLKDECLQMFMGKISGGNWLSLKFLAIDANSTDLNRMLDQNIEASSSTILPLVLKSKQFLNLTVAELGKLLWKKNFNVNELTVIKMTEAWLSHEKREENPSIFAQVKSFELLRNEEVLNLSIFDGKPTPLPTLEMDTPGWVFLQSIVTPKKLAAAFKAYDFTAFGSGVTKTKLIDPQVTIPMEEKVKNRKRMLEVEDIGNGKRRNTTAHHEVSTLPRIPKKESSRSSVGDESKSWDPLGGSILPGKNLSGKNGYGEERRTGLGSGRGYVRDNADEGRGRGSRISISSFSRDSFDSGWDNAGPSSVNKEDDSCETQPYRGGIQAKDDSWDCGESVPQRCRSFDNNDSSSRGGFLGRGRGRTDGNRSDGNRSDGGNTDNPWARKGNSWGGKKNEDSISADKSNVDMDDWGTEGSKNDWGPPPGNNFKGESRSRNGSFGRPQNDGGSSPWSGSGGNDVGSSRGNAVGKGGGSSWGNSGDKGGGSSWGNSGEKGGSSWGDAGEKGGSSSWGASGEKDGNSSWGTSCGKDSGSGWGRKDSGSSWGNDSSNNNDGGWGNRRDSGSSFGDRGRGCRGRGADRGGRGGRGGGRGGRREPQPGDWACDQCDMKTNFASKSNCFRCQAPKPAGAGSGSVGGFRGGGRGRGYSRGGGFSSRNNDGGSWGGSDSWGGGSSNATGAADDDDWDAPAQTTVKAAAPAEVDDEWGVKSTPAVENVAATKIVSTTADDEWDAVPAPVQTSSSVNSSEHRKVDQDDEWNSTPKVETPSKGAVSAVSNSDGSVRDSILDVAKHISVAGTSENEWEDSSSTTAESKVENNSYPSVECNPPANLSESIENQCEDGENAERDQKPQSQESSIIPIRADVPTLGFMRPAEHQRVHDMTPEVSLVDPRLQRRTSQEPKLPGEHLVELVGAELIIPSQNETRNPWTVSRIDGIVTPTAIEYELALTDEIMVEEERKPPVEIPVDSAPHEVPSDPRQHRAGLATSGLFNGTTERSDSEISDRMEIDNLPMLAPVSAQVELPAPPGSVIAASEDDGWE
ncbi:unnamed protein product [Allacma fusca]|uniref:Uncharacterized protein n=1 Tax=Allacma fusca TaxID=39272 RepID=A0A8J2KA10_9HEXA|nr:unnamed protein product [Allacma fusca]